MYSHGSLEVAKKINTRAKEFGNSLIIDCIHISSFPGDCGALCLNGALYANKANLKDIMEIASHTGHNKIFATIVGTDVKIQEKKKLFVDMGWTIINEGKSNRNSDKIDVVLFYFNPNCKKKGY